MCHRISFEHTSCICTGTIISLPNSHFKGLKRIIFPFFAIFIYAYGFGKYTYTNYMHIWSGVWSLWHVSTLTRWHYKGIFNKVPSNPSITVFVCFSFHSVVHVWNTVVNNAKPRQFFSYIILFYFLFNNHEGKGN